MLISYSLGSGASRHNLDFLAKKYLEHSAISYKEIVGSGTFAADDYEFLSDIYFC